MWRWKVSVVNGIRECGVLRLLKSVLERERERGEKEKRRKKKSIAASTAPALSRWTSPLSLCTLIEK